MSNIRQTDSGRASVLLISDAVDTSLRLSVIWLAAIRHFNARQMALVQASMIDDMKQLTSVANGFTAAADVASAWTDWLKAKAQRSAEMSRNWFDLAAQGLDETNRAFGQSSARFVHPADEPLAVQSALGKDAESTPERRVTAVVISFADRRAFNEQKAVADAAEKQSEESGVAGNKTAAPHGGKHGNKGRKGR